MLKCICGEIKFEVVPNNLVLATITDKGELAVKDPHYGNASSFLEDPIICSNADCKKEWTLEKLTKNKRSKQ